jgi:hypothetical protein
MNDWYKIYKVVEAGEISTSDDAVTQCNKMKIWLDKTFGDMIQTEVTQKPHTSDEADSSSAAINIYPKGMNKVVGIYYFLNSYSSSNNPVGYSIGIKTGQYSMNHTVNISDNTNENSYSWSKNKILNNLMLKVIKLKQCYIFDFYLNDSSFSKKKCRFMVADINGEKVAMIFVNNTIYYSFTNSTETTNYGSFLVSQSLSNKNISKFIFPFTDTWADGFYITDNIIDDNKPYKLNGKTFIDICGANMYRGIAVEVIEGDNELLYNSIEEEKLNSENEEG